LLGLLVAPSVAGGILALVALLAFVTRTPLRVSLVDRLRDRRLPRTHLADRVALFEGAVLVILIVAAVLVSEHPFWVPLLVAAPLVAIELWYDLRSRSRRLVPELTGTIGIGSVAAAIALAGGAEAPVAAGLWAIAAARAIAAVVFVRVQLRRAKQQPHRVTNSDIAQVAAVGIVAIGALLDAVSVAGVIAVSGLAVAHGWLVRTRPPKAPVLGAQQVVLGLTVVLVAGLGAVAP
jgi:hypothetical protein